jgi:hypothetical protein
MLNKKRVKMNYWRSEIQAPLETLFPELKEKIFYQIESSPLSCSWYDPVSLPSVLIKVMKNLRLVSTRSLTDLDVIVLHYLNLGIPLWSIPGVATLEQFSYFCLRKMTTVSEKNGFGIRTLNINHGNVDSKEVNAFTLSMLFKTLPSIETFMSGSSFDFSDHPQYTFQAISLRTLHLQVRSAYEFNLDSSFPNLRKIVLYGFVKQIQNSAGELEDTSSTVKQMQWPFQKSKVEEIELKTMNIDAIPVIEGVEFVKSVELNNVWGSIGHDPVDFTPLQKYSKLESLKFCDALRHAEELKIIESLTQLKTLEIIDSSDYIECGINLCAFNSFINLENLCFSYLTLHFDNDITLPNLKNFCMKECEFGESTGTHTLSLPSVEGLTISLPSLAFINFASLTNLNLLNLGENTKHYYDFGHEIAKLIHKNSFLKIIYPNSGLKTYVEEIAQSLAYSASLNASYNIRKRSATEAIAEEPDAKRPKNSHGEGVVHLSGQY